MKQYETPASNNMKIYEAYHAYLKHDQLRMVKWVFLMVFWKKTCFNHCIQNGEPASLRLQGYKHRFGVARRTISFRNRHSVHVYPGYNIYSIYIYICISVNVICLNMYFTVVYIVYILILFIIRLDIYIYNIWISSLGFGRRLCGGRQLEAIGFSPMFTFSKV